MSSKSISTTVLVMTLLAANAVRGQDSAGKQDGDATVAETSATLDGKKVEATSTAPRGLSNYITNNRPGCCGPIGGDGAVQMELYFRAGPSLPVGGPIFGHTLNTGWMFGAGGRTLFFNKQMDAAWTVDLGLSDTFNMAKNADIAIPMSLLTANGRVNFGTDPNVPGVTLRRRNRTTFNYALGREWYLNSPFAFMEGLAWRVGFDVGGRYGTEKCEFNEIRHRTGVVQGLVLSGHTDVEIPCRSISFLAGFRVEWGYTWSSSVLQEQNDGDMQEVNFLLTLGVRF